MSARTKLRAAGRCFAAAAFVWLAGCGGGRDQARQGAVATAHPLATRAAV